MHGAQTVDRDMKRIIQISLYASVILVLLLTVGWWRSDNSSAEKQLGVRPFPLTEMDFSMTDHEGNQVGPKTLIGKPSLVFFGFTYCPEICPTTLADISLWLDKLGDEAKQLTPVLISVDPERDTVEVMADYVSYFHPRIRGWTGTAEGLAKTATGFRASYEKVILEDGDYTMNHTAGAFLFRADGSFVATIDYHEPRKFAVPKIRRALKSN